MNTCGFVSRLRSGIKLYVILISASIRSQMQYKVDFIASTLIQALMGAYDFLFIAVILWRFKSLAGWNIHEVGLLYGISRVGWGLYRVFLEEVDQFERYIVRGDFDAILLRPWPSLFVLVSRNVELARVSWVIQGIAIIVISARPLLETEILTWLDLGHVILACIWTACLFSAIGIATASAAFAIVRIEELQVFTQNATSYAALHPLDIYPDWLKYLLLIVIPIGVGNYIPIKYLLGKGGTWLSLVLPGVAAVLSLSFALWLWRLGESRYHSTGS